MHNCNICLLCIVQYPHSPYPKDVTTLTMCATRTCDANKNGRANTSHGQAIARRCRCCHYRPQLQHEHDVAVSVVEDAREHDRHVGDAAYDR